ncbi:MAG: FMN-binding protein [Bacillota bacterium]
MKLVLRILLSLTLIAALIIGGGLFYLTRGLDAGAVLEINAVDLTKLNDGEYEGEYNGGRWTNKVKVTVAGNKIIEVNIEKDVAFAIPELSQKVIDAVLKNQNTKVDAVTGSTVTSKAYLKAIENALK